ncbi:hypothetical protein B0H14DRAFT_3128984 [Mycena olivaceomarginata]|nr:hypothetical protein B0H14DRAFT_3128984 [Mycena olivaceomarginata]
METTSAGDEHFDSGIDSGTHPIKKCLGPRDSEIGEQKRLRIRGDRRRGAARWEERPLSVLGRGRSPDRVRVVYGVKPQGRTARGRRVDQEKHLSFERILGVDSRKNDQEEILNNAVGWIEKANREANRKEAENGDGNGWIDGGGEGEIQAQDGGPFISPAATEDDEIACCRAICADSMRGAAISDGPAISSMSIPPKWHGRDGKVAAAARETV